MITQRPRRSLVYRSLAATAALGVSGGLVSCGDDDGYSVEQFPANADAFDALSAGRVDAVALTSFTIEWETGQMDGYESTESFFPVVDGEEEVGCGGFGFTHDDVDLRNAFNAELAEMQEAGEVLPIVEEFGWDEAAVEEATRHTAAEFVDGAYDDISDDYDEAALEPYRQNGVTIGTGSEPPYGFVEEGQATGQAPELARAVFDRLDIEVTDFEDMEFGALIGGLEAGRIDVISAGMAITADRGENVLFANPDYCAPTAFAVPDGNPEGITDFESAAEAGITMGVVRGTVEIGYAEAAEE
jgi:ABC-type amino acid transport substrate-binding protein